jgi:hypothetical protein
MRKHISKKVNERLHFKSRFKERFGVEINRHDIRELVNNIRSGDNVTLVERQSARVSIYRTRLKGHRCIVVYDRNRKSPVTCWAPKD